MDEFDFRKLEDLAEEVKEGMFTVLLNLVREEKNKYVLYMTKVLKFRPQVSMVFRQKI